MEKVKRGINMHKNAANNQFFKKSITQVSGNSIVDDSFIKRIARFMSV